jgi:hypothetical protein
MRSSHPCALLLYVLLLSFVQSAHAQNEPAQDGAALGSSIRHSLSLNGIDAYVNVPSSESLNIVGQITVEAWIKTNSSGRVKGIVERYNWSNEPDGGYALRLSTDNLIITRLEL